MPAAAVIPAPIVYLNVVAVKKLVVEFLAAWSNLCAILGRHPRWIHIRSQEQCAEGAFYFEEIRVFQAGYA